MFLGQFADVSVSTAVSVSLVHLMSAPDSADAVEPYLNYWSSADDCYVNYTTRDVYAEQPYFDRIHVHEDATDMRVSHTDPYINIRVPCINAPNHIEGLPEFESVRHTFSNQGEYSSKNNDVCHSVSENSHDIANSDTCPSPEGSLDVVVDQMVCSGVTVAGYKPRRIIYKRKKSQVAQEKKHVIYWEKRRKNNESARRSREAKKEKERRFYKRALELEYENHCLAERVRYLENKTMPASATKNYSCLFS